jgi:hypothetical protein
VTLGCSSMALDPSGRFLLVPYRQTPANPEVYGEDGSASMAVINTATGATSTFTLPSGQGQAPGQFPVVMSIATVAW